MEISVVIPLFNKKETISRALDSIKRQTYQPREVVVVNDGSTDGSEDIAAASGISGLRVISQKNSGVSVARNRGVEEAGSDWVALLDADDEWLPDFLQTIKEMHENHPKSDLYATAYFSGDYRGHRKKNVVNCLPFSEDQGIVTNYFEVAARSSPPICSSAVCLRKKKLLELGGFPKGISAGEDLVTWARIAAHKNPVYSKVPLAIFWKEKAHTYDDRPKRIPDKGDPVGKILLELRNDASLSTPFIDKYIGLWHKMRASIFLRIGMRGQAFRESVSSLAHDPLNIRLLVYLLLCTMPDSVIRKAFNRFGQ